MGLSKHEKIIIMDNSRIADNRVKIGKKLIEKHNILKNKLNAFPNDYINSLLNIKLSKINK